MLSGYSPSDDFLLFPPWVELLRRNGLAFPESILTCPGELLSKPGLGHRQRLRVRLSGEDGQEHVFYLKRYRRPPLGQQFRRFILRGSFAASAWWEIWAARQVTRAGIPTFAPAAFVQRRLGPFEIASASLVTAVPESLSLEQWFARAGEAAVRDAVVRRTLVKEVGRLIRRLHHAGLVHRDLYLCHVFLQGLPPNHRLFLIDLARVFRPAFFFRRWAVKDLAALNYSSEGILSRTERLRGLLAYLDRSKLDRSAKRLIRQVLRKTVRVAHHDRKRRERLGPPETL